MLRKLFLSLTGIRFLQKALHYNVVVSQYLQGIGAGTDVWNSGEGAVLRALVKAQKKKYCVFDVGANKGQFGLQVLSVLGPNRVDLHCFEPSPTTYSLLVSVLGKEPAVRLNNEALGKRLGHAELYSDNVGSGLASLTRRKLDHFGIGFTRTECVAVNTVDNYCELQGISHIDLLKIDVEGHELDVLLGAERVFKSGAVDMVSFEFGGCNIDTRSFFQDFFYFFSERKMTIFRITPSGYLMQIDKYAEICEQFRTTNFVAMRE